MGPGSEDGVAGCSNRPRRKRMLACCCMAVAIVLCASGCTTLSMHGGRLPDGLQIDGLGLDDRAASTTREVISMLDLDPSCASPASPCAERILVAPGTIREGTRLVAAADVLYRAARRDRRSQRASQLQACVHATRRYLHAPSLPGRENAISARSQLALRLHNACTAELALDAISATGVEGFDWDVDIGSFPQQSVRSIALAAQVRMRGLRTRQVEDGLGVAAIAYGRTTEPVGSFPAQPFALPVSILAEPGDQGGLRLVVRDASRRHTVATALGPVPLARDMSAAYAAAALAFEHELGYLRALFDIRAGRDDSQIRLLAPMHPRRTAVILVHGFASSPMTWANMVNELLGDPDISAHYQFWLARYATGYPALVNRQQMAGTLRDFRSRALADGGRCPPVVLVGHSMGGVIARLLVTRPGTALWDAAFVSGPEALPASWEVGRARELFIFDPIASVDTLVMIAAPHGGSDLASGLVARLLRRFIRLPVETMDDLARLATAHPDRIRPELLESYRRSSIDSLSTLSPGQPVMRAARSLPVEHGIALHSIIGIRDPDDPASGDGIVSLDSAHWPAGSSDYVTAGHDLQAAPATISTLKRILLERLQRLATPADPAPPECRNSGRWAPPVHDALHRIAPARGGGRCIEPAVLSARLPQPDTCRPGLDPVTDPFHEEPP